MKIVLCGDLLFSSRNLANRLDSRIVEILQNADAAFCNAEFSTPKKNTPPGLCMYLTSVPQEIQDVNHALMIESLKNCYETLVYTTQEIEQEEEWIANARKELTEHVLAKQEMEIRNTDTYRFMHDLLGADILEIFDKDYDVWKGEINREHKQV